MTLYPVINSDMVLKHGEENAVASFYQWMSTMFKHSKGYEVLFDKDGLDFEHRKHTNFPCIVVQQLDTVDEASRFIGGKANMAKLMFYIYIHHHAKHGGTRRTLRRSRDQVSFALRYAGIQNQAEEFVVDPIYIWDYSVTPATKTGGVLTVEKGIQQRFIQDGDLISYEFMVSLDYVEQLM